MFILEVPGAMPRIFEWAQRPVLRRIQHNIWSIALHLVAMGSYGFVWINRDAITLTLFRNTFVIGGVGT